MPGVPFRLWLCVGVGISQSLKLLNAHMRFNIAFSLLSKGVDETRDTSGFFFLNLGGGRKISVTLEGKY